MDEGCRKVMYAVCGGVALALGVGLEVDEVLDVRLELPLVLARTRGELKVAQVVLHVLAFDVRQTQPPRLHLGLRQLHLILRLAPRRRPPAPRLGHTCSSREN